MTFLRFFDLRKEVKLSTTVERFCRERHAAGSASQPYQPKCIKKYFHKVIGWAECRTLDLQALPVYAGMAVDQRILQRNKMNQNTDELQNNATVSLLDSPPVLQNPSPHGVTVTWTVNAPATGWVEYGPTPTLGQRADAAALGQHLISSKGISVRRSNV